MPSKNKFEIHNDEIIISRQGWDQLAFTTYVESYYSELSSVTWTKESSNKGRNAYLKNRTLGYLHRYVMAKWYGKEMLDEMDKKGWIVDHMNNNGLDCRISNLEFLHKSHNTAKGQIFDKEAEEMRPHIAVNIFKDFSTGNYQITIGCNDAVKLCGSDLATDKYVNAVYLLYSKTDYKLVILDAERILIEYENRKIIPLQELTYTGIHIDYSENIELTPQELREINEGGRSFIIRDGKPLIILGKNALIHSIAYKKGWTSSMQFEEANRNLVPISPNKASKL